MRPELTYMLKPYQRRWIEDESRFKIGLWCRQSGKDYTAAAEAVLDCINTPKNHWLIVACGERQARETLRKARDWAEAIHFAAPSTPAPSPTVSEITWENGSRLTALPAKPETIRGYSANLILTEFAFHEKADELWRAIYPSITNAIRGGCKKVRILSTPNGRGNKFHELWGHHEYQRHKVTIHDAVREGMPLPIDELRRGLNDAEAWAQEYECEFTETGSVLLPYPLLESCEDEAAQEDSSPDGISRLEGELVAGLDFGRKRDLTVCWILQRLGGVLWTREVLTLRGLSTADQLAALRPRLQRVRRVALDYTGAGVGLGDFLVREFGEFRRGTPIGGRIELCAFTPALKGELFPRLRAAFEAKQVRIPPSRDIREDLHGIYKSVSAHGIISYRAHQTPDGHSDRATALALACRAAEK